MKKGILIIGIGYSGREMFDFAKGVKTDTKKSKHNKTNRNFVLLSEGISPNKKHKYYEYQFDNGGLGYSRVYWSVIENKGIGTNLFNGKIPDGYKIKGWTKINELILEKWKPYYHKKDEKIMIIGSKFNGIQIKMLE